MSSFELLHPYALLIVPLYLICLYFCKAKKENSYFSNVKLLKRVYTKSFNYQRLIEFFTVLLLSLALSEPVLKKIETKYKKEGIDIVLALDASVSMLDDNKFKAAKETLKEFIKKREDDNLALIVFANKALIASPLSNNPKGLLETLKYLKPGVAGSRDTAIYEALYKSGILLENSRAKSKVVILLTDGINTIKRVPLQVAIDKLKKYNIKLYTIGVGSDGDFNKKELKTIAKELNGAFFSTSKPKDLKEIYNKINSLEKSKTIKQNISYYKPLFKYPLIFASILILLLIYLKRDDKRAVLLLALATIFNILALFNPADNFIKSKKDKIYIALDCSSAIYAQDLYPNRFEFVKVKLKKLIDSLDSQIALIVFNKKTYLLSPLTHDKDALKYLIEHLNCKHIRDNRVDFLSLLKGAKSLNAKKILIISSGGEQKSFEKELKFAKKNGLKIYAYHLGTKNGGVVKIDEKIVSKSSGEVFYSYLNEHFKSLSKDGYIEAKLNSDDIDGLKDMLEGKRGVIFKSYTINYYILLSLIGIFLLRIRL